MTGKIFINYRRGDDPGHTGRLFDRLQDTFDPQQLFLDVVALQATTAAEMNTERQRFTNRLSP